MLNKIIKFLTITLFFSIANIGITISQSKQSIEQFIHSPQFNKDKNINTIIIAMDIDDCYNCNAIKISGILKNLKQNIKDSKAIMVVESPIPKDAFSLKGKFESDIFIEDTNATFSRSNLLFPNIIVIDKYNNFFILNFYDLQTELSNINFLLNTPFYNYKNRKYIKENNNNVFSSILKPYLIKNELFFLAQRKNQIIRYNLKLNRIDYFLKPTKELIIKYSDIKRNLLDSLEKYGFFNIDFLFDIISFDYNYGNNEFTILIDKLSEIKYNNKPQLELVLNKKKGILKKNISGDNSSYTEFKRKNYVRYDDINCNRNYNLLNIKYGSNYKIKDTLALILNIRKNGELDTLININDLNLTTDQYLYKVNKLVDVLRIGAEKNFYFYSNKLSKVFYFDNNGLKYFNLNGLFNYYSEFELKDMLIIDDKVFILSISTNSRILIQSYDLKGKFLNEDIYYISKDELLSTQFVKNINNKIILLNKWRNKRWSLDYINE